VSHDTWTLNGSELNVTRTGHEEKLRRLALLDEGFIESVLTMDLDNVKLSDLPPITHALIRLGALLAAGAAPTTCHSAVTTALAVGASSDEVVGTLIAVTPIIGLARAVSAAAELAIPIGFDLDAALENPDPP
jgi:hypothetical protein